MNLRRTCTRLFILFFLPTIAAALMIGQFQAAAAPHAASGLFTASKSKAMLDIENGLTYLYTTQNGDGSWGGTAVSLNGLFPTTNSVVQALRQLEEAATITQTNGIQYLTAEAVTVTPFYAGRILSLAGTGQNITADLDALLARQNSDGGWCGSKRKIRRVGSWT